MIKIILRSIFYHWLILFVGVAVGFIFNAEWVGYKSILIEKSINHIFFPIKYNDNLENIIKDIGKRKLEAELDYPKNFQIIDELLTAQEIYVAKYSYTNEKDKKIIEIGKTRVLWKTWEMYYHIDEPKSWEK
jgi:hypothetical protein